MGIYFSKKKSYFLRTMLDSILSENENRKKYYEHYSFRNKGWIEHIFCIFSSLEQFNRIFYVFFSFYMLQGKKYTSFWKHIDFIPTARSDFCYRCLVQLLVGFDICLFCKLVFHISFHSRSVHSIHSYSFFMFVDAVATFLFIQVLNATAHVDETMNIFIIDIVIVVVVGMHLETPHFSHHISHITEPLFCSSNRMHLLFFFLTLFVVFLFFACVHFCSTPPFLLIILCGVFT